MAMDLGPSPNISWFPSLSRTSSTSLDNKSPVYVADISEIDMDGWAAYDLLSIPAMSAENERIFSGTQDLIPLRRN
jgi:hypothetical protein